ncbi:hypothetical protein N7495_009550 [Penicillium taxi]|uniref:uncharacterized protein n=1 Tax=Penicillium taxi TaxID=168475 RepID=UPI002544D429|nr:uncharacterized protein N7495_009550 [Penicillium taxi]KAJ5885040.1 hypothetical protein N7495_009550 [Penicillium taxi]
MVELLYPSLPTYPKFRIHHILSKVKIKKEWGGALQDSGSDKNAEHVNGKAKAHLRIAALNEDS